VARSRPTGRFLRDKPCRIAKLPENSDREVFRICSVGYMRVSSADDRQSVDLQRDALVAAGVDERHLYKDKASGARDDRPGLKACLEYLKAGDTLVVWKLDRARPLAAEPADDRHRPEGAGRRVPFADGSDGYDHAARRALILHFRGARPVRAYP
jgi:hypothetical protein